MTELPAGYALTEKIDLMRNRKQALLVNGAALLMMAFLIAFGFALKPAFEIAFDLKTALLLLLLCVASVVYMVLHELVHGVFIRRYSHRKPKYGFTGMYAYAGSDAYFDKWQYLCIAFAPVVLLGILLAVLNVIFYEKLFWFFYLLQVFNLSGAAGDFYVSERLRRYPPDTLIFDDGTSMAYYTKADGGSNG